MKEEKINVKLANCDRCHNDFPMMEVEFCEMCFRTLCPNCYNKYGVCSEECKKENERCLKV